MARVKFYGLASFACWNLKNTSLILYKRKKKLILPSKSEFITSDRTASNGAPQHKLAYYTWGNEHKPALMCVHGLSRNARDFDKLAVALSSDFYVTSIDMPGRGKSEWLNVPEHYHYGTYVQDIIEYIEAKKFSSLSWVGTSMGGILGMMIAAGMPKLINKMVINDIGAFIPKSALERLASYIGIKTEFFSRGEAENFLRNAMKSFGISEESDWQHIIEHSIEELNKGVFRLAYDPNIAWIFKKKQEDADLWSIWEKITTPTMIIRGKKSDIFEEQTLKRMRESLCVKEVLEIDDVGHAPMLMNVSEINAIHAWLTKR